MDECGDQTWGLIDPSERQHALQYRAEADQNHQQFEKICQPAVHGESVDGPETNRPDDDNDEYADQYRNHVWVPLDNLSSVTFSKPGPTSRLIAASAVADRAVPRGCVTQVTAGTLDRGYTRGVWPQTR
jgi:hypothetical protein